MIAMTYKAKSSPNMSLRRVTALLSLMALVSSAPVSAGEHRDSFVIKAGRVITVAPGMPMFLDDGVVIVRDGKIVAVGTDLVLPPDLPVIEMPDATVMPGLVAAATDMIEPHSGDESIAAGYHAVDAFDLYDDHRLALAGGVTSVHLNPGNHRLVTGQGAVVKLGGAAQHRILRAQSDLTINLGEAAFNPPDRVEYRTPASSDVAIPPAKRQRPSSRMGQLLALRDAIGEAAFPPPVGDAAFHRRALNEAWSNRMLLRVQAQRSADLLAAVRFADELKRKAYVVGGAEAEQVADALRESSIPLVFRVPHAMSRIGSDLGLNPEALDATLTTLGKLDRVRFAIAGAEGAPVGELRLAAATAAQSGLQDVQVLAAITRVPAEILGVSDRVGSLAPGRDADLLVLSGDPLATSSHVQRVYIGGRQVFEAPDTGALVVRAGTIWVNEKTQIRNGSVLIEKGKVAAVGSAVPHPPFARFIDAGADAMVTPGFIDARGHLGLEGDTDMLPLEMSPAKIVGVPDITHQRVALQGVTTILLSPYRSTSAGAQIAAVKTAGPTRQARVVKETSGVIFDLSSTDPMDVSGSLGKRLEAGKKYREKWLAYEKELEEWKKARAEGRKIESDEEVEEKKQEADGPDPITGTWDSSISGGPLPEPQTFKMRLRLTGSNIEGRVDIPGAPMEVKIVATFDGKHISGEIQIDTGGRGYPQVEADLVAEDQIVGTVSFEGITADLEARRTDKAAVEFKVVKRKTRGKDGRPLPPKVDEALEPLRAMLDKKLPAVVHVDTAPQIAAVLKVTKEYEVPVVLVGAEQAAVMAKELVERAIGVIVPRRIVRWEQDKPYHQADDLSRKGIDVAFQSEAEDGARTLRLLGLHAVERGLSPDAALAAFTTKAARMYKLDDRVGSLDVGREGDLVIFDGHPFAAGSRVKRVIVGGEEVNGG